MAKSSVDKKVKDRELKKHLDLILATFDYYMSYLPGFSSDNFKSLKKQAHEHYEKGRLTKLKQWFRDITEEVDDNPRFREYIKNKTGLDIDLKNRFEKRIERIIKNAVIKNENQFRDVMEKLNDVSQLESLDKKEIEFFNSLLVDFENRQRAKRK